jgi:hypothetical protein
MGARLPAAFCIAALLAIAGDVAADTPAPPANGPVAAGRNAAVKLVVPSFALAPRLAAIDAPAGRQFLVIDTRWENIIPLAPAPPDAAEMQPSNVVGSFASGSKPAPAADAKLVPVPYLAGNVGDHLHLVVDGARRVGVDADATAASPHPLPLADLLVPSPATPVSGQAVFAIPSPGVESLELVWLDTTHGNIRLKLFGTPPLRRPIAAPVSNAALALALTGFREAPAISGREAPRGRVYAIAEVELRSEAGFAAGNITEIDTPGWSALAEAGGYRHPATTPEESADALESPTRLLPEIPERGTLAFLIPAEHGALSLELAIPSLPLLRVAIPNSGPDAPAAPPPLLTLRDGQTLTLACYGVRFADRIVDRAPEPGNRYVVLDLGAASAVDDGIELQTAQLAIIAGNNESAVDEDALQALAHPLIDGAVIPPHGRLRFDVAFQVPSSSQPLALLYRGLETEEKVPLPTAP